VNSEALYTASVGFSPDAVALGLRDLLPVRLRPISRYRYTCLDTFDGRIGGAGARLTALAEATANRLVWYPREWKGRLDVRVERPVEFAWDLPAGPIQSALEPIVQMRRLLPQVEIETEGTSLDVLDDEGKTVARIKVETARARVPKPAGRWRSLPTLLTVTALRGYEKQYRQLLPIVESRPGFERCLAGLQSLAMRAVGASPPRDVSKLDVRLDPAVLADPGARQIHRALLDILIANEAGIRADIDTEFLHDFRVAVRSARSLLGQLEDVFDAESTAHFAGEFAWLGRVTGPTRDLDVLLLTLGDLRSNLPADDLAVLRAHLVQDRRRNHGILIRQLNGTRYQTLLCSWREFLAGTQLTDRRSSNAARPLVDLVSRRAWCLYRRIVTRAAAIDDVSTPELLHRIRLDSKKVRYLICATRSIYPVGDLRSILGSLKDLQAVLGEFNDADVHERRLVECARVLASAAPGRSEAVLSIGRLAEQTRKRAAHLRPRIARELQRFSTDETRLLLRRALKHAAGLGHAT
jgi:CHAD domain-containing protein